MAMYSENQNRDKFWNSDSLMENYNSADFGQQEQLQFQSIDHQQYVPDSEIRYSSPLENFNLGSQQYPDVYPTAFSRNDAGVTAGGDYDVDEPPLLEELGIDTDQIILKSVAVLNPFHASPDINAFIHNTDLAGPIVFCIAMGACIFFSGGKANFGYVYGFAVTGCIMMYVLLNLMTTTQEITLATVASVLGYCLLPVVVLSALGIFFSLRNPIGLVLSLVAVVFCSMSASKFFVSVLGDANQRLLIAYPCALLYAVFDLITIF